MICTPASASTNSGNVGPHMLSRAVVVTTIGSHRIQELEKSLGVRLLHRTSRRFGLTEAGSEFYRHSVAMLRQAERAETAIRHRLHEPSGTVRCTASAATMQFALSEVVSSFLVSHPKVNVVAH